MSEPGAAVRADWPDWPDVDVVMPIRDEAEHLDAAVGSVLAQDYPGTLRVYLAVAPSNDDTREVAARLSDSEPRVVVVDNPAGVTPAGLNLAIRAGSAPIVVRVDGHSQLSDGYVRRAVETLGRTGAANVGGMQVPDPHTDFERAVAAATTSWLGTGGASYRLGGTQGPVDTVYLGVFDRRAIESVGLFDERLIRNQDYELNIRLREAGHQVWFDPELRVGYRPRGTWRDLARQYYEYGQWKAVVIRMHPSSLRIRQLAPPAGIAVGAISTVLAVRWPRLLVVPAVAATTVVAEASRISRRSGAPSVSVLTALVTIPVTWTIGLATGRFTRR